MSNRSKLRLSRLTLGLAVALAAAPAFAQQTSSALGGTIMDDSGQPVAGADVLITHTPSGTISRAITDDSGRYVARGLRVGGPYTVLVLKDGYQSTSTQNVELQLAQTSNVSLELSPAAEALDVIEVIGNASTVFSPAEMGSGTSVNQRTIEALPSVNGNIQDYMRLDPRVAFIDRASGSISAGGQNPRFNKITIDGVSASDTFGLEGNNMPTKRQPVSIEAIEAIDIDLSNYDVSIAGATGANVNAVTKSGTNEFHGSVYGSYRDGDWFGENPDGDEFNGFTDEQTYGATFGGPLLTDRLFFFANYEKFKQSAPGADLSSTPLGDGTITMEDIARAQQIASGYGIDAGTLDSNGDTDLDEAAIKLDWNISDFHRASFRYSQLDQSKLRINNINSSAVSLSSNWYQHDKSVESYVGQVFSDWSDNFATEMKISFRDYTAIRNIPTNAPNVRIYIGDDLDENNPRGDSIFLGTEINSQDNILETETWNYFFSGNWLVGDHEIKFGFDYSDNDIYNFFGRQSFGDYVFAGLDNFAAGRWSRYDLHAETAPGSIAAAYSNRNLGVFVQDSWYVNNNLSLTFGLRADRPDVSNDPAYNAAAEAAFGYDNSRIFEDDFLIQPRFGFNYTFDSERPTQLRGGIGLFQGDAPQVWVGNSFANTGFNYDAYTQFLDSDENFLDLPFSPDGRNQPIPTNPSAALQDVNFVGDDFKLPSVWKANLAIDHETPWQGIVASAELLLTSVEDGLFYRSLNIGPGYTGPDGRTLYWDPNREGRSWSSSNARFGRDSSFGNVFLIENTNKGGSQQLTLSLSQPFTMDSEWAWSLAYTYTNATEVGTLTSSTAGSGFGYQYGFNIGEEVAQTARYEIQDRFTGSLNWERAFFGDYKTSVGLFYEGRSGRPFSYIFNGDANGDSRTNNDLFYVPSGPGDVLFGNLNSSGVFTADPAMEQAFFSWLSGNPELARYAGSHAPANGFRASWVNTFDVRISQDLPSFFDGHKAQLTLDIQNVGNLINDDWGHIVDYGFFANARVATLQGIHDGQYVYNYRFADDPSVANNDADSFDQGVSQWSVMLGFRYQF